MAIKIFSALFTDCVTSKEALPDDNLPIVALVGRSNVGKSSLINAITNRKELAKTGSSPGKTLTINFYKINDEFYIVDLPGYGYAKASKVTRHKIQEMMNEFFRECANLKGIVQILDARHKPGILDRQMYDWLREQKLNFITLLTKTDKLGNQQLIKMRRIIQKELGSEFCLQFSSKNHSGKEEFLEALEKILAGYRFKVPEKKQRRENSPQSRQVRGGQKKKNSEKNIKTKVSEENSEKKEKGENENLRAPEKKSAKTEKSSYRNGQRRKKRHGRRTGGRKESLSEKPEK